ncbi:YggS family pyridoxal phosphate-dependent enzyme [Candidatus Pelagibacter sp.]|nr:YggS family pyridoxal phosphate-dependent enzyme [Candidatus Pelagibacter sp.]
MQHITITKLNLIKSEVQKINKNTKVVAVSKTFDLNNIMPLINDGHIHFGENKVQEAANKWTNVKRENRNIKLHMVGKLQSNKVKYSIPLFDYIHSLDSLKLAEKISKEQEKRNFRPKIFVQVNIGREAQKNGIYEEEIKDFVDICKLKYDLDIEGLMCIPPNDLKANLYFEKMNLINKELNLNHLSMGMSQDYILAAKNNSTFIRVGSKIFGQRFVKS